MDKQVEAGERERWPVVEMERRVDGLPPLSPQPRCMRYGAGLDDEDWDTETYFPLASLSDPRAVEAVAQGLYDEQRAAVPRRGRAFVSCWERLAEETQGLYRRRASSTLQAARKAIETDKGDQ